MCHASAWLKRLGSLARLFLFSGFLVAAALLLGSSFLAAALCGFVARLCVGLLAAAFLGFVALLGLFVAFGLVSFCTRAFLAVAAFFLAGFGVFAGLLAFVTLLEFGRLFLGRSSLCGNAEGEKRH